MPLGTYIALDAINGAGKTTQVKRLYERAIATMPVDKVVLTREPTSVTAYGKEIRERLNSRTLLPPREMAMLFALDRASHMRDLVRPAVEDGALVIGDRCIASSMAYQGAAISGRFDHGSWHSQSSIETAIQWVRHLHVDIPMVDPDITVILDMSTSDAMKRLEKRRADSGLALDQQEVDMQLALTACAVYRRISLWMPRVITVSAMGTTSHVEISVRAAMLQRVEANRDHRPSLEMIIPMLTS